VDAGGVLLNPMSCNMTVFKSIGMVSNCICCECDSFMYKGGRRDHDDIISLHRY
jgi:hypothetical protein